MITLVILSYNHSSYIIETLESICSIDVEKKILIIDDGSSDDSVELVNDFINQNGFKGIAKLISKENKGLIDSLNLALKMTDTEYVYFIASDDVVIAEKFKQMFSMMVREKKASMIIGNAYIYNEGQSLTKKTYNQEHIVFFEQEDEVIRKELFINFPKPLLLQSSIFRTDSLKKINGWDTDLQWDDYPMFVKMFNEYSMKNKEIIFSPNIGVVKYRQHPNNTYKNIIKQVEMVDKALLKLAPQKLLNRAMAKQYAFYILLSLKEKDIPAAKYILKRVSSSVSLFWFLYFILDISLKQIRKRVRK